MITGQEPAVVPCPEGAATDQPGATPRELDDHPRTSPEGAAHGPAPRLEGSPPGHLPSRRTPRVECRVGPFQGRGHHLLVSPGRCPGLVCCGPCGATSPT